MTKGDRRAKAEAFRSQVLSLLRAHALLLTYMVLTTVLLGPTEGWPWYDCLYFSIVTLTTVGYGDLTPTSAQGKALTVALSVGGLVMVRLQLAQSPRL